MKVLVIPEDFRKDQYILKPIVGALLKRVPGGRSANIVVCSDPLLGGVDQATRWERIAEVIDMYPMIDLFLLLVDRDGVSGRRTQLTRLESQAAQHLHDDGRRFLAEHAWQELEVWTLAGLDLPKDWQWKQVREEWHPKENYFLPLARMRGLVDEPGEGRKTLSREAASQFNRIRSRCPEDIGELERRLTAKQKAKMPKRRTGKQS